MSAVVNSPVSDLILLRDYSDTALTGKVSANFATIEAYQVNTPATTATVTLTEIGAGEYAILFTPTTVATWAIHLVYNSGGVFREFAATYDVVASQATGVTAVTPVGGVTRLTLRQRIARELGDIIICTATAVGTSVQFKDTIRLVAPDYAYAGREAYFISGTVLNLGQTRYVSSSTQATGLVTLSVALPAATAVSDGMELHNFRGQGWMVAEIHDAIDQALTDAGTSLFSADEDDIATVFNSTNPSIVIPAAYIAISSVLYQPSETEFWQEIEPADGPGESGWWLRPGQGEIILGGQWRTAANGLSVRVVGYKQFVSLTTDASATTCNTEWVIQQACAYLSRWGKEREPSGQRRADADRYQARADRIRDLISGVPRGGTVMVL